MKLIPFDATHSLFDHSFSSSAASSTSTSVVSAAGGCWDDTYLPSGYDEHYNYGWGSVDLSDWTDRTESAIKDVICLLGGIPAIIASMQAFPNHLYVQLNAIGALENIACRSEEGKKQIVESGGIPAVVTAMKTHANEIILQRMACMVLEALSDVKEWQLLIFRAGGFREVASAYEKYYDDSHLRKHAFKLVQALTGWWSPADQGWRGVPAHVHLRDEDIMENATTTIPAHVHVRDEDMEYDTTNENENVTVSSMNTNSRSSTLSSMGKKRKNRGRVHFEIEV